MQLSLLALAASQSLAMRPELGRAAVSKDIQRIGEVVSKITGPQDSLAMLKQASSMVSGILAQGPADDHMSDDDRQLLSSVVDLIEKTIFGSMDSAHQADVDALNDAIAAISKCNSDVTFRQSPEGDLGILHAAVQDKQTELDRLQGVVDEKTEVNNTKWEEFDSHMQMISDAPACPDFPARTMPALDVYFEKSDYSVWFSAQQSSYNAVRAEFAAADSALQDAIDAYNLGLAKRNVQYCDWKNELDAACHAYVTCFVAASNFYRLELKPRVETDMNGRIEVYKAGETLVHQVHFLLGEVATQETPAIDTARYEIEFPKMPGRVRCDQRVLDSPIWQPAVVCFEQDFKLVGEGKCRTPLGQQGASRVVKDVAITACQEQCFADRTCLAIGYDSEAKSCEIHTDFIDRVEASSSETCMSKTIPFALVGEGWCRTPKNSSGTHATHTAATEGDCLDLCRADESCMGVEFDVDGRRKFECELHFEYVDRLEPHNHGICLVKETTFSLVGTGACAGGAGTHTAHPDVPSEGDCMALCRNDDSCLAVEFAKSKHCELHTEIVDSTTEEDGVICLSKD